jgi:hypothetical protein
MTVLAIVIPSVSVIVSAIITGVMQSRTHTSVKEVKDEIVRANGNSQH